MNTGETARYQGGSGYNLLVRLIRHIMESHPIVLYDGVCGLCNRLIQFLLKRDRKDRLRFASLQSEFAKDALQRHGLEASDLDTVQVIVNAGQADEKVLARSDAIIYLLEELGGIWTLASLGKIIPRSLRDSMYKLVARNRYRVFGKYETCMLPEPRHRAKFVDTGVEESPNL
jgi:predicted DCC family thiol-disulfide oxidoreductase YuxK